MTFKNKIIYFNIALIILTIINIKIINKISKDKITDYTTMIASKITKYIVNNAYIREDIMKYSDDVYQIQKNDKGQIINITYDSETINKLLNTVSDRVYNLFNMLEYGDLEKINIRENILVTDDNKNEGIVMEIPSGIIFNNYLLSNLGPKIPIKITLTGEFESFISTDVSEYGINNALITINMNIIVSEQITMPFITKKIIVENKFPLAINLINGEIPNYYIGGFNKNSNLYTN